MKLLTKLIVLSTFLLSASLGFAADPPLLDLVPETYRTQIRQALKRSGKNAAELEAAIKTSESGQREGIAFLIANMPPQDLRYLKSDFLLENVRLAYQTLNEVRWGKRIPPHIFLNEVLPYASVNERRDNWRRDFHDRFLPVVRESPSIKEAALKINKTYLDVLKISYDALKRPKPDQSPYESIQAHYASCTGFSILLVDALRAVGIPARVVGIPLWPDKSGNHTWVEVWDGDWHYLGAGESESFDHAWFSEKAAQINSSTSQNRIYAVSFKRTRLKFPSAWKTTQSISAVDVTARYARSQDGDKKQLSQGALYYVAPSVLPHTDREMKTAGFWIARHPNPDKVVLDPLKIKKLNDSIRDELKATRDITRLSLPYSGNDLKSKLEENFKNFAEKKFFDKSGRVATKEFFQTVKSNMNFEAIGNDITPRYGFIMHYADERFLPTEESLNERAGDIDFDELQNDALDIATPVAILNESVDHQWFYVLSWASAGWVRSEHIAVGSLNQLNDFLSKPSIVVVTTLKSDIYLNSRLSEFYDYAQMGTVFPISISSVANVVQVTLPKRNEDGTLAFSVGYIRKEDVHEEYLLYTPRTILEQAFKLLNEPYGWGGMYGEQDCSRFLQQVFATVGIQLPRNSKEQGQVGCLLAQFSDETNDAKKLKVLDKADSAVAILPLKGHIMLYLGVVDKRPYAIHAVWAYRENTRGQDRIRVINRVAVTDLYLGEGSKKGSLLHRLNAVRVLSE